MNNNQPPSRWTDFGSRGEMTGDKSWKFSNNSLHGGYIFPLAALTFIKEINSADLFAFVMT